MEIQLEEIDKQIKEETKLLEIGNKLFKLKELEINIDESKEKLKLLTERQTNLDKIKQIVAETGSHAMEETVETINNILYDISLTIFTNETIISLNMFKELKTKDYVKPEPNVIITRGYGDEEETYDFDNDLCGGEQSRVSLALTLALATISTTPFLLLDESFSSLDNETTDKCLEIMKKYCENKTIINVCHNINEGIHDNKVEIINETI